MDVVELKKETDLTEREQDSLASYVKNGKPGLLKSGDTDISTWFNLYMSGKSYTEISEITKSRKDLILFHSDRNKWFTKRMNHYQYLAENVLKQTERMKLESVNTINTAISALGKYYKVKFDKFLMTNDNSIIEEMDTRMLAQYYKAIESLDKIVSTSSGGDKKPMININMGAGSIIEKMEDDSVVINDETATKLLKALAESKKDK